MSKSLTKEEEKLLSLIDNKPPYSLAKLTELMNQYCHTKKDPNEYSQRLIELGVGLDRRPMNRKEEKSLMAAFKLYGSNWHSIAATMPLISPERAKEMFEQMLVTIVHRINQFARQKSISQEELPITSKALQCIAEVAFDRFNRQLDISEQLRSQSYDCINRIIDFQMAQNTPPKRESTSKWSSSRNLDWYRQKLQYLFKLIDQFITLCLSQPNMPIHALLPSTGSVHVFDLDHIHDQICKEAIAFKSYMKQLQSYSPELSDELLRMQVILNQVLCLPTQAAKEEMEKNYGEMDSSSDDEFMQSEEPQQKTISDTPTCMLFDSH